jgi:hypothetical protein
MVSPKRLPEKERRKVRRQNHIAKDLGGDKYRQRVIPNKRKKEKYKDNYYDGEDY